VNFIPCIVLGGDAVELVPAIVLNGIDVFLLVLVRLTGLFVVTPVFGTRNVPAYFKIGFAFFMTIILINTLDIPGPEYSNFLEFAVIIAKEFLIGLALGFIAYLIFNCIYMAGEIVDMQVGFGMVNIVNPLSNIQVPLTANFYYIISLLMLISVKGHYMIIKALYGSYEYIPIDGALKSEGITENVIRLFRNFFITGFKIAAPITAAILITDIMLGIMAKAVPQLNIFVLGLPIKIVVGMALLTVTLPVLAGVLEGIFKTIEDEMVNFLRILRL